MTIKKIGIWEIDDEFGLIGNFDYECEYQIRKEELWVIRNVEGRFAWEWVEQLKGLFWFTESVAEDFNFALIYAQVYFNKLKPKNLPAVTWEYSKFAKYIQQEIDNPPSKPSIVIGTTDI